MHQDHVRIVEVGPRDGLQSISTQVKSEHKIKYINLLTQAKLGEIEVTSFVSPKWVPQLADASFVSQNITKDSSVRYTALVPNKNGLIQAMNSKYRSIAVFTAASETFSEKNTHCSIQESFQRLRDMGPIWKKNQLHVRGYISTVWHCPYEGEIDVASTLKIIEFYLELGIKDISLGDTIGKAKEGEIQSYLKVILSKWDSSLFSLHFHDTFGYASKNIEKALELGIRSFDASAGGIGGCPFAPGAAGNVSTEKVTQICHKLGYSTDVDLSKLEIAGKYIQSILGKDPVSNG